MASMDLLIEKRMAPKTLQTAIAKVLGVPVDEVGVISDVTNYPSRPMAAVCLVRDCSAGFEQFLTVDWSGKTPSRQLLRRFVEEIGIACLVPTTGQNPYLMDLIRPDGTATRVSINSRKLDEEGVYVLSESDTH